MVVSAPLLPISTRGAKGPPESLIPSMVEIFRAVVVRHVGPVLVAPDLRSGFHRSVGKRWIIGVQAKIAQKQLRNLPSRGPASGAVVRHGAFVVDLACWRLWRFVYR